MNSEFEASSRSIPANDPDPARALSSWGGTRHVIQRVSVGVNRSVWKVSEDTWLTATQDRHLDAVQNEVLLLDQLSNRKCPVSTPRVVLTSTGEAIVKEGGWLFWLTENLAGVSPDPRDENQYGPIARSLANLHSWLKLQHDLHVVSPDSALSWIDKANEICDDPVLAFKPAQISTIRAASAAVRGQVISLSADRQLIHGDPSHPNLVFQGRSGATVGFLDWESARLDSPLSDLAVVAQTILFRSGAKDAAALLFGFLSEYERHADCSYSLEEVACFLVAAKLESVAHHGRKLFFGNGDPALVASQPAKVSAALRLLQTAQKESR